MYCFKVKKMESSFSVAQIFCKPNGNTGNTKCMDIFCSWRPSLVEMNEYVNRLRTFDDWPSQITQSSAKMSSCGFYYIRLGDKVKCFQCGIGIGSWKSSDNPYELHKNNSPNCSFIKSVRVV